MSRGLKGHQLILRVSGVPHRIRELAGGDTDSSTETASSSAVILCCPEMPFE